MKTIDAKQIHSQLNRCYLDFDPTWRTTLNTSRVDEFKDYLEHKCGLKMVWIPAQDKLGRIGFEIKQVEVINDPKFALWLLRWT
jgi:hypothetical protein